MLPPSVVMRDGHTECGLLIDHSQHNVFQKTASCLLAFDRPGPASHKGESPSQQRLRADGGLKKLYMQDSRMQQSQKTSI
jgi:hypothetical protein